MTASMRGIADNRHKLLPVRATTCTDSVTRDIPLNTPERSTDSLILRRPTLRELEPNTSPRQLPINLGISIQPIIDSTPLLLIQHDLQHLRPILASPSPLAHNLDGINQIGQDGVMHCRQGAGAGTFLRLRGARPVRAFGAGKNTARGEDQDVAVGEFLFELAGEAGEA